jgi:hypothetical protein
MLVPEYFHYATGVWELSSIQALSTTGFPATGR